MARLAHALMAASLALTLSACGFFINPVHAVKGGDVFGLDSVLPKPEGPVAYRCRVCGKTFTHGQNLCCERTVDVLWNEAELRESDQKNP